MMPYTTVKPFLLRVLLTLLDSLAQIDAEFLVSHERFGSNDALIPKMADGRR